MRSTRGLPADFHPRRGVGLDTVDILVAWIFAIVSIAVMFALF